MAHQRVGAPALAFVWFCCWFFFRPRLLRHCERRRRRQWLVARGGTESPFRAEGGGEEGEYDDMEDSGDAAGLGVGGGSAATVVASSSAVLVGSVLRRPVGTGTVVFKRYVRV
jgi:hypothetical protein